jgi:hypothetical protein
MHFQQPFRAAHGRPRADRGDAGLPFQTGARHTHRENARDRRHAAMQADVRRGKSESPAQCLPRYDPSPNAKRTSEERADFAKLAGGKRFADPRRAHHVASNAVRHHFIDRESARHAGTAQYHGIALASPPEPESLADHHAFRPHRLNEHLLDECSRVHAGKRGAEPQHPQFGNTGRGQCFRLVPQPHQSGRRLRRRKILTRVRLECEHGRRQACCTAAFRQDGQDRLVPEVQAVEIADRDDAPAVVMPAGGQTASDQHGPAACPGILPARL